MPEYRFVAEATISVHTVVDADTLEEAARIALERSPQEFCYHCADKHGEEWASTGELDYAVDAAPLVEVYVDDETVKGALERARKIFRGEEPSGA